MKKLAIFGGTFNPVHEGHLSLCRACMQAFSFDKLLLIPDNHPPHKEAVELASNEDRKRMLELAASNEFRMEVSDIEFRMGGTSYTVNTVSALMKEYPDWELYLILGTDMLLTFREWKEWERILSMVFLITGERRDEEYIRLCMERETYKALKEKIFVIQYPPIEVSSTEIRKLLKEGKDVRGLLNPSVLQYIKEKKLYGCV